MERKSTEKPQKKATILMNDTTTLTSYPCKGAWDCIIKINGKEKAPQKPHLINTTASH
jgi:hypothetical protein